MREEPCGGARALGSLRAAGPDRVEQPQPRHGPRRHRAGPAAPPPASSRSFPARCVGGAGPVRKNADALNAQGEGPRWGGAGGLRVRTGSGGCEEVGTVALCRPVGSPPAPWGGFEGIPLAGGASFAWRV